MFRLRKMQSLFVVSVLLLTAACWYGPDDGCEEPLDGIISFVDSALDSCVLDHTRGCGVRLVSQNPVTGLRCNDLGIVDLSGLEQLTGLETLELRNNLIQDIGPLGGINTLLTLDIANNQVSAIAALDGLTNLAVLHLSHNQISDIAAFAAGFSCAQQTIIWLDGNLLDSGDNADITTLIQKGCDVRPPSF